MKNFNQHRVKELAILLFLTMSPIMNLDAQCTVDFPTKDTLLCAVPVDSFPQLETADVSGCLNVTAVNMVVSILEYNDCTTDPNIYAEYSRVWEITHETGTDFFNDTICLERIDLMSIEFPGDTIIDCGLGDTSQASTGYPTVNGNPAHPIMGSYPHCNIWVDVESSVTTPGCPEELKVVRSWTIMDLCDTDPMAVPLEGEQTIHVVDTTAPEMVLLNEIKEITEHDKCAADITFPAPLMLSDNCVDSMNIGLIIRLLMQDGTLIGIADANRQINDVPPGQYDVEYTADDLCGNYTRDTTLLTVFDSIPPVAQGKDRWCQFNPGQNMMMLTAESFDDGSYDLCSPTLYFKVKRMNAPVGFTCANPGNPDNKFDDDIKFCCEDVGTPVVVIFRVYDRWVPPGPVEDDLLEKLSADFMLMVTVFDKAAPVIDCLEPDTIDCSEDLFDLSRLGEPDFEDNCYAELILDDIFYDLNECNIGTITRRFIATDPSGLADTCDHLVVVRSLTPFDADDPNFLIWPRDTNLYVCNAPTDTANTGAPLIVNANCANLVVGYEDEYYPYVENACFKILRKWKVYDWCQFDGAQHNPYTPSPGVWYHTQLIKISDTAAPELILPGDVTIGTTSADCSDAFAAIPLFDANDCSALEDMEFTYKVDFDNDGTYETTGTGNDASGIYPVGTHKLHVFLNDGCGNIVDDTMLVHIEDQKPPSPIFNGSLVAELMQMGNGGMVAVPARLFQSKSEDNCTSTENLRYAYSSDPNDSVRVYTCDSVGVRQVNIYVFDEAGNYDYTINEIEIQDNMNVCQTSNLQGDPEITSISGKVVTELGHPVDRVEISIVQNEQELPTSTNRQGQYNFGNVRMHQNYSIVPKKEINPINGVSTLDIVRITKHLLGKEPFESPYQIIASDINQNGSVTSLDIVHLRKLILGIIPHFRDNKSWEFINADYEFINPKDPFAEQFPTRYTIEDLDGEMNIDFIGVKLGDVNHSVRTGRLSGSQIRNRAQESLWMLEEATDGMKRISFHLKDVTGFDGVQFAIEVPENMPGLELVHDGVLSHSEIFYDVNHNVIRGSWNTEASIDLKDTRLFSIQFPEVQNEVSGQLSIKVDDIQSEVYAGSTIQDLQLKKVESVIQASDLIIVSQNRPNPFMDATRIDFEIQQDQSVEFSIYDLEGKIIHNRQMALLAGKHEIQVDDKIVSDSGIYLYELRCNGYTVRNKMIKIK